MFKYIYCGTLVFTNLLLCTIYGIPQVLSSNITSPPICNKREIELNTTNVITIRGVINDKLASDFVYELNKNTNRNKYVYINSPGGSVDAGLKIVEEIQKNKLDCIAQKAYSMGFIILQSCRNRYITNYASVMQHQISFRIGNEKKKIENYIDYINQIEERLINLQIKKIGIHKSKFLKHINDEWWIMGENILKENIADEMINVNCTSKLTNQKQIEETQQQIVTYSKCPLITEPIEKKSIGKDIPFMFF
jgi:ATP-dependent protease ClpP protease subunit